MWQLQTKLQELDSTEVFDGVIEKPVFEIGGGSSEQNVDAKSAQFLKLTYKGKIDFHR